MSTLRGLENFEQLNRCPLCGSRYPQKAIILLEETEKQTTFHLSCSECRSAVVVFLSASQYGLVSIGMATDLKSEEAKKFYKNDSISPDEVLEVHEFLKKSDRLPIGDV